MIQCNLIVNCHLLRHESGCFYFYLFNLFLAIIKMNRAEIGTKAYIHVPKDGPLATFQKKKKSSNKANLKQLVHSFFFFF